MRTTTIDQLGREEAEAVSAAIDALLELHQVVRDSFPGVPQLEHRAMLQGIAAGLRADYQPRVCELVPTRALEQVAACAERLQKSSERCWMDDRVRHDLDQLLIALAELERSQS